MAFACQRFYPTEVTAWTINRLDLHLSLQVSGKQNAQFFLHLVHNRIRHKYPLEFILELHHGIVDVRAIMANKRPASPELSPIDGFLKRGKAEDDIETIKLFPRAQAWDFDVAALLDSPTHVWQSSEDNSGNNFKNYDPSESLFILCVIGELDVQYQMLWYVPEPMIRR